MNSEFELFPDAASTAAPSVDRLYIFMLWLSLGFTVLIAGLVVYFALKYRRGNRVDRTQLPTSIRMELPLETAAADGHSVRSARIGEIEAARRAGRMAATNADAPSANTPAPSASGSQNDTPYSCADSR